MLSPREQLQILAGAAAAKFAPFGKQVEARTGAPLRAAKLEILQINVGKLCNQTCKHCHVDAGPTRREIMSRETMELCLQAARRAGVRTIDITGGAPELNPHFRWLVEESVKIGAEVIDRCNLTVILSNPRYHELPEFFARQRVHLICSLPYFDRRQTDRQRGEGVFEASIEALRRLNAAGYAHAASGLQLDLVYNPVGAFLPASQAELEADFKRELSERFGLRFNRLYAITNMPISRFLEFLVASGNLEAYMERLVNAFNPAAVAGLMCRNTLSVGWDGRLYDCDFNQMLEMGMGGAEPAPHIRDFDARAREGCGIAMNQHCYGCTAGAGSSCGGSLT